jgi:hypothetical protein
MESFKVAFGVANPFLLTQWNQIRNSEVDPSELGVTSNMVVWWICETGHEWQQRVFSRSRSKNCPICINQLIQPGINDLATLQPELVRQWHFEMNGDVSPSSVSAGSNRKFWWVCDSGHDFEATVSKRVRENQGCPFCKNKVVLVGFNDLATTHPQLAASWHPSKNQPVTKFAVIAGTAKKYWWVCDKGHEYEMSGDKRTKGIGCPVCSNYSIVKGVNDLAHTNPELALEWNYGRNSNSPSEVVSGSHKKVWWLCVDGHEWQASPVNRVYGTGCPTCSLGGFDPSARAFIYFISNQKLGSRKVGITNATSERLDMFKRLEWKIIETWEFEFGIDAKRVEKHFFAWLRSEVGLPPHLDGKSIGKLGGWTETFSYFGPSDAEVIERINSTIDR